MTWETWEPGRVCRVPVVRGTWRNWTRDWVVIGPRHEDSAIIAFPYHHFHLDPRFVPLSIWREAEANSRGLQYIVGAPLMGAVNPSPSWVVTPTPLGIRRRTMLHQVSETSITAAFRGAPWEAALRDAYCGQSLRGTVCPHRGADLRGFAPGADGMVTCPLHGLRFEVTA